MPGLFDRIKDTWIAASPTLLTTLSTFAVTGTAPGGYQTFSTRYAISDANIPVAIVSQTSADWMTCWCTYTSSNTLRIDTIMFSSNGDAGVTFPAGTMDIFVTPAARAIPGLREANTFTASNTFSATTYYGTSAHGNIGSDASQMFVRGNNISFQNAASSTTYAYINSSGNVGIGTPSPSSKLTVSDGTVRIDLSPYIGTTGYIGTQSNHPLGIITNNAEAIRVTTSGNVGIGTAGPASKLVVSAAAYNINQDAAYLVAGTTSYTGATTNWGTYGFAHKLKSTAGGVARVALDAITAGGLTEIFCADTSGNFGIGTPSPNRKLTVSAGGSDARISILDSDTTAPAAISLIEFFGSDARGGYVGINSGSVVLQSEAALPNGILFSANGAERMRITNTGNVGIGTTPSERLSVFTGGSEFAIEWVGPGKAWVLGSAAGRAYIRNKTDSVEAISILNDGKVGIGTTSPSGNLTVFSSTGNDSSHIRVETSVRPSLSLIQTGVQAWSFWVDSGDSSKLKIGVANGGVSTGTPYITATTGGNVGIGTANPSTQLHVVSAANFQPQIISEHVAGAGTGAAYFMLDRARGTVSAKTAVVSGDTLGTLMGRGYDGSAIQNSAWIEYAVDGTVSAGNVPGSIALLTTPVGGSATTRMRIAANGYVSIGTSSPSALLTIDDNAVSGTGLVLTGGGSGQNLASFIRDVGSTAAVKINASSGNPQIVFESSFNTFTIGTSGNDFKISDDPVLGNNDRLTINSSGNVGVGVSSPAFRFVAGNSSTDGGWIYSSGSVSYLGLGGFSAAGDGAFQISYDRSTGHITFSGGSRDIPVPRVTLFNTGLVGINQTSPGARLHVTDADSALSLLVSGATRGLRVINTPTGAVLEGVDHTGVGSYQPLSVGGSDVRFTTSNNERMRISTSGAVSFHSTFDPGILSVNIGAGLLRVYRQNTSGEGGQIEIARSADNGAGWYIDVIGSSTNSPDELRFVDAHNAAVRFNFTARGVAGIVNDLGPVSTDTLAVGFRGSPNNDKSADYILALTDAGRTIRKTVTTAFTVTIPADATVNFPLGTCIMLCNVVNGTTAYNTTNNLVIACAAGGPTLVWLNGTAKNNRTPGTNTLLRIGGSATLRKVAANLWTITGAGIA